jgi:hypothetical protein
MTGPNKHVRFGDKLTIVEFPMTIGDNPSVSAGCPVALGRKPIRKDVRNLEFYEYCRQSERRTDKKQLKLPVEQRGHILLRAGYSIESIAEATLAADKVKEERLETLKKQGWDGVAAFVADSGKIPKGIMKAALTTTGGVGGVVLATGGLLADAGGSIANTTGAIGGGIIGGIGSAGRSLGKRLIGTPKQHTTRAASA